MSLQILLLQRSSAEAANLVPIAHTPLELRPSVDVSGFLELCFSSSISIGVVFYGSISLLVYISFALSFALSRFLAYRRCASIMELRCKWTQSYTACDDLHLVLYTMSGLESGMRRNTE